MAVCCLLQSNTLEDSPGLEDSFDLEDIPGLEDSPELEDSSEVEVQGMVVGGPSTAGVEVEAGKV